MAMFINTKRRGYDRGGQQVASGRFLMVFSHNMYKWSEQTGRPWPEFPADQKRKLYACVRFVSLQQCGHFMMGTARIAGQSITVSGTYGSDGLPMDYESLTPAAREKLTPVPDELAERFWKGGGHNSAGSEALSMLEFGRKFETTGE